MPFGLPLLGALCLVTQEAVMEFSRISSYFDPQARLEAKYIIISPHIDRLGSSVFGDL